MQPAPHEYDGATELPYTDHALKAEAKVRVKAFQYDSGYNKGKGYMNVYLEDMPFTPGAGSSATGGGPHRSSQYVVYVDFNRFNGADALVGPEDRFFVIDLTGTSPAVIYREDSPGVFIALGSAQYHPGTCAPDASTSAIWRCNGELRIPLGNDMRGFPSPDDDVDPGVGFEVFPFDADPRKAWLPEIAAAYADFGSLITYRHYAVSLLFARPKGYKLQYMTWNVRRSSVSPLAGDFSKTPDASVGEWLADKADVIALQEGWDKDKMAKVLSAAADRRSQLGLAPFYSEGPPDVTGGIFKDILRSAIQEAEGGDEGSSGGVWTLSKFPVGQHDFHIYSADACKGEDCFKAKAVLWTRIMLNPPSPANTGCDALGASTVGGKRCGPPPSGGEFVDVFNTHLNATDTTLCSDDAKRAFVLGKIAAGITTSGLGALAVEFLQGIYDNDLNCSVSDDVVQRRQLDEMNAFISAHAAPDRPSVIMGDFNVDGRHLGAFGVSGASQYRELLRRLRIGPVDPQALYGNMAEENDDMANPWPLDFDWDVDHGDLARDAFTPYPADGTCMGTFIGEKSTGVEYRPCPRADNADGHERYDYILVRPPYQSDDPNFAAAKWVAERVPGQGWHSPYPGPPPAGKVFSGPPDRLSDHKPVLVGLEHAKLVVAPKFHPDWKHDVELRVASYDASDQGECIGCGDLDPYVSRSALFQDLAHQSYWVLKTNHSSVCDDAAADSYPPAGCMSNWYAGFAHDGAQSAYAFGSALFDADDGVWGLSDEALFLRNGGTQPVMWVVWGSPTWVGLLGWEGQSLGTVDWYVADTEPIPISTNPLSGGGPTNQCLLFTAKELPPGQQF